MSYEYSKQEVIRIFAAKGTCNFGEPTAQDIAHRNTFSDAMDVYPIPPEANNNDTVLLNHVLCISDYAQMLMGR